MAPVLSDFAIQGSVMCAGQEEPKGLCPGCEEPVMNFPARFLVLEAY